MGRFFYPIIALIVILATACGSAAPPPPPPPPPPPAAAPAPAAQPAQPAAPAPQPVAQGLSKADVQDMINNAVTTIKAQVGQGVSRDEIQAMITSAFERAKQQQGQSLTREDIQTMFNTAVTQLKQQQGQALTTADVQRIVDNAVVQFRQSPQPAQAAGSPPAPVAPAPAPAAPAPAQPAPPAAPSANPGGSSATQANTTTVPAASNALAGLAINATSSPTTDRNGICNDNAWIASQAGQQTVDFRSVGYVEPLVGFADNCIWDSTGNTPGPKQMRCEQTGLMCTLRFTDGRIQVFRGESGLVKNDVTSYTYRWIPRYATASPFRNECYVLTFDRMYGSTRNPAYPTEAGNFDCPAPSGATPGNPLSIVAPSDRSEVTCTNPQAGIFVCKAKRIVTISHPGGTSQIDVWPSYAEPTGCTGQLVENNVTKRISCTSSGTFLFADAWTYREGTPGPAPAAPPASPSGAAAPPAPPAPAPSSGGAAPQSSVPANCPKTGPEAAELLKGGDPARWQQPDAKRPDVWVYKTLDSDITTLTYPGFGQIDHPNGSKKNAGTVRGTHFTFKCVPDPATV